MIFVGRLALTLPYDGSSHESTKAVARVRLNVY